MSNKNLGVLLVDVPEPSYWKYTYFRYKEGTYDIFFDDGCNLIKEDAYKCTQEEAKNTHSSDG